MADEYSTTLSRLPYEQWYWSAWFGEVRLLEGRPELWGCWHDLLGRMWQSGEENWIYRSSVADLAGVWHLPAEAAQAIIEELIARGVCDGEVTRDQNVTIISRRRYRETRERKRCASKQKRYRDRKRDHNVTGRVAGPLPGESESESESCPESPSSPESTPKGSECTPSKGLSPRGATTACPSAEIIEAWNHLAEIHALSQVKSLTSERQRSLHARWTSPFWRENWRKALDLIPQSSFCLGQNDRNWRANFEWFARPNTVPKLMEGFYADGRSSKRSRPGGDAERQQRLGELEAADRGGA
ncbi:MAG TPA: hypothetical protein VM695_10120 [Phycisphaerae bacterium]|nr:hypothetical protein [Phycisphaerae bacterium]